MKPAGAGTGSGKKAAIEREMEARGEGKENPFLEYGALVDLGEGVNGYAGTAHGGFFGVVLDEVMGTAANAQAGMFFFFLSFFLLGFYAAQSFLWKRKIFEIDVANWSTYV